MWSQEVQDDIYNYLEVEMFICESQTWGEAVTLAYELQRFAQKAIAQTMSILRTSLCLIQLIPHFQSQC